MEDSSASIFALLLTLLSIVVIHRLFSSKKKGKSDHHAIPYAPGGYVPFLGHALEYRRDPARFLLDARDAIGGDVFRLNLAGKRMIVVCGPSKCQRSIAGAPESVMSARDAVAKVGFEEMLGRDNVHRGTDLHKGIIKGLSSERAVVGFVGAVRNALRAEISTSLPRQHGEVEFMALIRRVILRAVIEKFIGPSFLDGWDRDFVGEFMSFQDVLEDATAKSAVMPRALALPLLLWPLRRRREILERVISKRLNDTVLSTGEKEIGFWVTAVKDSYRPDEIAHFIVGLLFAAHKNPAIGAAQSYLMLRKRTTLEQIQSCVGESQKFLSDPTYHRLQELCPTLSRLCMEALRLTAHSIGGLRTAAKDFSLGDGIFVARGSTVALAHITSSLNPHIWKDPNVLDLNIKSNNRSKELYEDDYAFSVFSHGIHKCPGQKFAMIMLPCTVAILLTEYSISLPETIPPVCFERATLAQRAGPVHVVISKNNA